MSSSAVVAANKKKTKKSKPVQKRAKALRGVSDIRRYFLLNERPIYFVSATSFNLLGMDEWVRGLSYVNYINCFDGRHPNVFVPYEAPHEVFQSIEDINNYLLGHKAVIERMQKQRGGRAVFLMFDDKTEELCGDLDLEVCFPRAKLRQAIDDKIGATRIGDKAGVKSVPNVLAKVKSYGELLKAAKKLGDDLVVQTAFGDSGHTTFFIKSEAEYQKHAEEIAREPEVKIMRRIRCQGAAMEACVTRHGTVVGPLMTELVGFKELTPYKGGWCGNELYPGAFPVSVQKAAQKAAFAFGEEIRRMGYRGYFELDFLIDLDSGKVYLGEVNPRLTGASAMTNLSSLAHSDAPLFLFHLLEFSDVNYDLDVEALNRRWSDEDNYDTWGQLVIKHNDDLVDKVTRAPESGIWRLNGDGSVSFVRSEVHRRSVRSPDEGFFLRITGPGDYRYEGADLGILMVPGRLMDKGQLNERGRAWLSGLKAHYSGASLQGEAPVMDRIAKVGRFKIF